MAADQRQDRRLQRYYGDGVILGYDAHGNVANRNGHTYTFDYGNRLRTTSGPTTNYVYDGHGRRVRDVTGASRYSQYSSSGQLMYTNDLSNRRQSWSIYLGGSLVAIRERNIDTAAVTNKYQHTDALGSPVAITSQGRSVLEKRKYEPYGLQISPTPQDGPGYTGHVYDAATGMVYMQQRYYDPFLQRFVSVDPVNASSINGFNFNRYWYAANSPYKYNDPDGRFINFLAGAAAGAAVEIFVQVAIEGKSFSQIDKTDVAIAAGVGAVTSGVGAAASLAAARGTIAVGGAVARTAAGAGVAGAVGSVAKDVANGAQPDVLKAGIEGVTSAAGGAAGSRLALAPLAKIESMAAKGGISQHVAETTRNAIVGSDKAVVAAASSATGANAGEALNTGIDLAKAKAEQIRNDP